MYSPEAYLDFEHTAHAALFESGEPVWSALSKIEDYLLRQIESLGDGDRFAGKVDDRASVGPNVYVAEGATVEAFATVKGPAWIGAGTTIRSGAYVRENVIVGENCMMGNSSEFKNCLLFDNCEVPHFNYVGDSILGYKAHLGAGALCSNVRLDRRSIRVDGVDTGLLKFGAIIGDRTEVGCNTVLSPGTIFGRDCIIHPCTHWHGVLGEKQIVKNRQPIEIAERR